MADKVFNDLFAFILHQELKPGDRQTVDDLVRQFGVSQTPVCQALSRSQADGLVVNKLNSGFGYRIYRPLNICWKPWSFARS